MIIDIAEDKDIDPKQAAIFAGLDVTTGAIGSAIKMARQLKHVKVGEAIPKVPLKTEGFRKIVRADQRQELSKAEQLRRALDLGQKVPPKKVVKALPEKAPKPMVERLPRATLPEATEKQTFDTGVKEIESLLPVKFEGKAIPMGKTAKTPTFVRAKAKPAPPKVKPIPKKDLTDMSGGVTLHGGVPLKAIGNALEKLGEPYRKYFADPFLKKVSDVWYEAKKKIIPKKLHGTFLQVRDKEYLEIKNVLKGEYAQRFEDVNRIYAQLNKGLTEAEKLRLGQIIKGSITTDPRLAKLSAPAKEMFTVLRGELRKATGRLQDVYTDKLTKQQLKGLFNDISVAKSKIKNIKARPVVKELVGKKQTQIKKHQAEIEAAEKRIQTHYKYGGTDYMPRMYISKENQSFLNRWNLWPRKRTRMDLRYAFERENIPEEVRKNMGEILKPGYPVATGLAREAKDLQIASIFNKVSISPEWTKSISELAKVDGELFVDFAGKEFVKMPSSKGLGALSEKFVVREIADDVNEILRVQDEASKLASKLVSQWKAFKVLWNPATQARNIRSNVMLADYGGGLSPVWDTDIYLSTFKEYLSKGQYYKEAQKSGLLGTTWYGTELKPFAAEFMKESGSAMQRMTSIFPKFQNKLGRFYQGNEEYFKLAVFTKQRINGKTVKEAADIARTALFDYSDVPKFINQLRTKWYGMPFITFPFKAMPQTARSLVRRPLRTIKWFMVPIIAEETARRKLGITKEKLRQIRATLPDYMKNGFYALMPWTQKDEAGKTKYVFYDFTFDLPWGDFGEAGGMLGKLAPQVGGVSIPPRGFQPFQNPLFSIPAMYAMNKNPLTGAEIYKNTDTLMERWQKVVPSAYMQIVPSPIGFGGKKIIEAAKGRRGKITTALHVGAGMKFRELKPERERISRLLGLSKEIKDLQLEIGAIQRRVQKGYLSREKADKEIEKKMAKITQRQTKIQEFQIPQ